jgi:hypothetical protein
MPLSLVLAAMGQVVGQQVRDPLSCAQLFQSGLETWLGGREDAASSVLPSLASMLSLSMRTVEFHLSINFPHTFHPLSVWNQEVTIKPEISS